MAKELFIVFLYDTELHLREEEDPQLAVVYFHPSWVNPNQRMALCGQLIGVAQFLATNFTFPLMISLQCGKFTLKRLGRYIVCVGTDRNIPDWILEKRCDILFSTLQFFHNDLEVFNESSEEKAVVEKLFNTMQVYLPVLYYAGSFFNNNLTIRLPKSASGIFLEAAQILEWMQTNEGVRGGAIFYQNKIVMSQLSAKVTKQIVITDPNRIKIPADNLRTSFKLPSNVQLLVVYVDEPEFNWLKKENEPIPAYEELFKPFRSMCRTPYESSNWTVETASDRLGIFTVVEEELENDKSIEKDGNLSRMPDLVKDTVKTVQEKLEKKRQYYDVKIESYLVNRLVDSFATSSCSSEILPESQPRTVSYLSFNRSHSSEEQDIVYQNISKSRRRQTQYFPELLYYNTISDPINPWFRSNGLPASKFLRDDHLASYYQKIDSQDSDGDKRPTIEEKIKRPTTISLTNKNSSKKNGRLLSGLLTDLKREFSSILFSDTNDEQTTKDLPFEHSLPPCNNNIALTPLMSKLSLLHLSQRSVPPNAFTPTISVPCITAEKTVLPDEVVEKLRRQAERKPQRRKAMLMNCKRELKKTVMFIFGHENISLYLLLAEDSEKNEKLIKSLHRACVDSVISLAKHFEQSLESIPQAHQALNTTSESYSYLQLHSVWETLQHGGLWASPPVDLLGTIHSNFTEDNTITDITVRMDDNIVYGSQMASNQVFYLQNVSNIAGLPMPSDLMGIVSLKAKRRLERDHGMLMV